MLDTIIIGKNILIKLSSNSHQKKFDEKIKKGLMNDESLMRVLTLVNKGIGRSSHHFIKNIRFLKQQIKHSKNKAFFKMKPKKIKTEKSSNETDHLLSSKNKKRLLKGIQEVKEGKIIKINIEDL